MTSIFPHTWCMELYDKHFRCMEVNPGKLQRELQQINLLGKSQILSLISDFATVEPIGFLNWENFWFLDGADLGFSRGGGRIFEKISKILTTFFFFFRSTKLIFRALPKHCFAPILAKFCAPQANFWKNSKKKPFLGTFWKILTKKIAFFLARAPPQSYYILAPKAPLEKF